MPRAFDAIIRNQAHPNPNPNPKPKPNPNPVPNQVWEVLAADLSISPVHTAAIGMVDPAKGIALRFPRFIRTREDKGPEDATNATQIAQMYNDQACTQSKATKTTVDDDDDW